MQPNKNWWRTVPTGINGHFIWLWLLQKKKECWLPGPILSIVRVRKYNHSVAAKTVSYQFLSCRRSLIYRPNWLKSVTLFCDLSQFLVTQNRWVSDLASHTKNFFIKICKLGKIFIVFEKCLFIINLSHWIKFLTFMCLLSLWSDPPT